MVNPISQEPAKDALPLTMRPLTVLYDGACPLCRREIGVYRNLPPLHPDSPVCFADVNDLALPLPPGTTRGQLLARFHVRTRDGALLSGAQAFLALWASLPGWRWLALLGRIPGAAWMMERGYRLFLQLRPVLQWWAFRLSAHLQGKPAVAARQAIQQAPQQALRCPTKEF